MQAVGAGVLVRHKLAEVRPAEGPGIDDLLAVGIDDGHDLTRRDKSGLAASRRNFNQVFHGSPHVLNAIKLRPGFYSTPAARSLTGVSLNELARTVGFGIGEELLRRSRLDHATVI